MQNLLLTKQNFPAGKENPSLNFEDLVNYFFDNTKNDVDLKLGMEFERLPLYKNSMSQVPYFGESGIQKLLEKFNEKYNWEPIIENSFLIGLKKNSLTITLEPGAQIEISSSPAKSIFDIEKEVVEFEEKLDQIADKMGITLYSIGISPFDTYKSINLIPQKRYHIMSNLLSGEKAMVMMRETAGTQVALDYVSEEDAMKKLKLGLMLSPFALAIFSNSPIHAGKNTCYKSYRATAWLDTDDSRCGLVSSKIFGNSSFEFEDYVKILLNVPMLYFVRNENYLITPNNFTFKMFMQKGFNGYFPTMDDFLLHLNLYFPDVRLRNYIELRNHDSLPQKYKFAPGAFYKGLLYSRKACDKLSELFENFSWNNFSYLRENVPKSGLKTKIKKTTVNYYATKLLELAYENLDNDKQYLEKIMEMVSSGKVPADETLTEFKKYL